MSAAGAWRQLPPLKLGPSAAYAVRSDSSRASGRASTSARPARHRPRSAVAHRRASSQRLPSAYGVSAQPPASAGIGFAAASSPARGRRPVSARTPARAGFGSHSRHAASRPPSASARRQRNAGRPARVASPSPAAVARSLTITTPRQLARLEAGLAADAQDHDDVDDDVPAAGVPEAGRVHRVTVRTSTQQPTAIPVSSLQSPPRVVQRRKSSARSSRRQSRDSHTSRSSHASTSDDPDVPLHDKPPARPRPKPTVQPKSVATARRHREAVIADRVCAWACACVHAFVPLLTHSMGWLCQKPRARTVLLAGTGLLGITSNVLLGNRDAAANTNYLKQIGVSHVLNCAKQLPPPDKKQFITCHLKL